MSGLTSVFNIAKDALAAQRYGMNVTAHNIANVDTKGYSRQAVVFTTHDPMIENGVILGRGVTLKEIRRFTDKLIENQLTSQQSNLASSQEMESYMQVLEGYFNETKEYGLSAMLSEYWNMWQDLSNNPSGASERIAMVQFSASLTERFNSLNAEINTLETYLSDAVSAGVDNINQLTDEISRLNQQIVSSRANSQANDLLDRRHALVSELSQLIELKTFEQSSGAITVVTARGAVLVQANQSYDLTLAGSDGKQVVWEGAGDTSVEITGHIENGKLGGWLNMRDEVLAKVELDFDELAQTFIWQVNQQHSQGVGLDSISTLSGTYAATDTAEELGTVDSGLTFYDKISDGSFEFWVYDSSGAVVGGGATTISVDADPGGTTLISLRADINAVANISASINADGTLKIDAAANYTFAFSDDSSNVLAALGINTYFTGTGAGSIALNSRISADYNQVAAAQVDADGALAQGNNANALAIADLANAAVTISQWTTDRLNGNSEGSVSATIEGYYHGMISALGLTSRSITNSKVSYETLVNNLSAQRDAVSGVSIDEEMTELIRYQHAYAAAAKLIAASTEMLDIILELK